MNILLIEPFYGGSHKLWADNLKKYSSHSVTLLTLSAHHWKWRMHGGAITLAKKFVALNEQYDLILCSDMLDISTFQALTRDLTWNIPFALYFHENQIMYPRADDDVHLKRDRNYGFINFKSALCADYVFFNSHYHRNGFLQELPLFLKAFPDYNELDLVKAIEKNSKVLPLFLDLKALDQYKPEQKKDSKFPVILWNHRWEYDKNPEQFFNALMALKKIDVKFKLVVLGQKFAQSPEIFEVALTALNDRILHWGYAMSYKDYAHWLWKSDIIPVTSNQDFFGGSVIEAMYCGTIPLLPDRLAFPEHIPEKYHNTYLYQGNEFYKKLEDLILNWNSHNPALFTQKALQYDCQNLIGNYDLELASMKKKSI